MGYSFEKMYTPSCSRALKLFDDNFFLIFGIFCLGYENLKMLSLFLSFTDYSIVCIIEVHCIYNFYLIPWSPKSTGGCVFDDLCINKVVFIRAVMASTAGEQKQTNSPI